MHPYIESLNSTKVFSFEGQELSLHHSFWDLIVLCYILDREDKLKACFFKDSELKEINPIYQSFKRIKDVDCYDYKEAFEMFNILEKTSIKEIEEIRISGMNVEEFE